MFTQRSAEMHNLSISGVISMLFRSFSILSNATEPENDESKEEESEINVKYNLYSETITFKSEKYQLIRRIITEQLCLNLYRKEDTVKRNGEIFKNERKTVTVTLYESTDTILVQGSDHSGWTQDFVKEYRACEPSIDDSQTDCKVIDSFTTPKLTSTPCSKSHVTQSTPMDPPSLLDVSDSLVKLNDLAEEIRKLQIKLEQMELRQRKTCDVSTQTDEPTNAQPSVPICEVLDTSETVPKCEISATVPKSVMIEASTNVTMSSSSSVGNESKTDKETYAAVAKRPPKEIAQNATNVKPGACGPSTERKNQPTKTLIIGSSIVQDISTRGLKDTQVRTMRGAGVLRVRTRIENTELCDVKNIVLQVGGNDISDRRDGGKGDLEACEEDFTQIVKSVKDRSPSTNVYITGNMLNSGNKNED